MTKATDVAELVDHLFRQEAGKMVAILTRLFGIHNLDLAEDIVQDTLHQALMDWAPGTIPDNPAAWLMTVARRKAVNFVKRERLRRSFAQDKDVLLKNDWTSSYTMDQVFLEDEVKDAQLRMIFTCCHPSLPVEAQIALTLKTLCGLSVSEIAGALLTTEANIQKRLYRAREALKRRTKVNFAVPSGRDLWKRLDAVLLVIYLLFNEGYHSTGATQVLKKDLCLEAMRLTALLTERPSIGEYPQTFALLALMCFHASRFDARIDNKDCLVILEDQDRGLWDQDLIAEGLEFLSHSAVGDALTEYHLEAGIAAEHATAPDFASTNWEKIYRYYVALEALKPSPVIRLNMAIVVGRKDGPRAAIERLLTLEANGDLPDYPLLHASLGESYYQVRELDKALHYLRLARARTRSGAILELLDRKIALCNAPPF